MKQPEPYAPLTQLLLAVNYMTKRLDCAPLDAVNGPSADSLRLLESIGLITIANGMAQRITETGFDILARAGLVD